MIKEIAVVTDQESYRCVRILPEDVAEKYRMAVAMTTIKPNTFVDDDLSAEIALVSRLTELCESEPLNIRWRIPDGCPKFEHYNDIMSEAEEVAGMKMFMNTKRFRPNYVIVSSDMVPILMLCADFKKCDVDWTTVTTYVTGTYRDIPVLVSPALTHHDMIWSVNNEITPGIVAFTKEDKVCYKIANPNNFVHIRLED